MVHILFFLVIYLSSYDLFFLFYIYVAGGVTIDQFLANLSLNAASKDTAEAAESTSEYKNKVS